MYRTNCYVLQGYGHTLNKYRGPSDGKIDPPILFIVLFFASHLS